MIDNNEKLILLVEDEEIIALSKKMILKKYGYKVIIAHNGEQAIDIIEKEKDINLILMDIDLGKGIDGTTAAQHILEKHDIPIVFMSSHTEKEIVDKTDKITSYGYIVKNSGETALNTSIKMAFRLFESRKNEKKKEKKLKESEELLRLFIEHAPAALAMFDKKMHYIAVSQRWISDFHLHDKKIIGKSHYELFPEITDELKAIHRRGIEGERIRGDDARFERLDGSVQWVCWEMLPWKTANGSIGGIIIFSEDITARKIIEEQLTLQLKEKEILLKEVHNQAEKNIASIGNLLKMQAETISNKEARSIITDDFNRIENIQNIYDIMLTSNNYKKLNVKEYFQNLITSINKIFSNKNILLTTEVENINIHVQQIFPLGVIANEIITNSLKYAFPEMKSGNIIIKLNKSNNKISLLIQDNGIGISEKPDISNSYGFSLKLVKMLVQQLQGSLSVNNNNGTKYIITFKENPSGLI